MIHGWLQLTDTDFVCEIMYVVKIKSIVFRISNITQMECTYFVIINST